LEALKQQLRERLIESGWRDKLAEQVRGGGERRDGSGVPHPHARAHLGLAASC
jgi:hypothetical protein